MITTKAATRYANFFMAGFMHGPWRELMVKHVVVMNVIFYPFGRVRRFVVPAVPVYRIDAIDLYEAIINKPGSAVNQFEIFVFIVPAHGGWEEDYGITAVAENHHFDIHT